MEKTNKYLGLRYYLINLFNINNYLFKGIVVPIDS